MCIQNDNDRLVKEIATLKSEVDKVKRILNRVESENDLLNQRISEKDKQISDYRRSVYLNSRSNSQTLSRYNDHPQMETRHSNDILVKRIKNKYRQISTRQNKLS